MINLPKLLLTADTYYPKVDGTLKFMEEFIKRSQQTFEITLLVPFLGKKQGENVIYLEPSKRINLSGYPLMKLSLRNFNKIKKTVKDSDIIFVQGPALISYLSIYYGFKYQKRTVFYTHTIAWELFEQFAPPLLNKIAYNIVKRFSIFFYNHCNEILVPYEELKLELRRSGVRTKITVAKLGVDIDIFSPDENKSYWKSKIGLPADKKVIGYVGRISREKNINVLFNAFKKLKDKDLQLLLVGDGPEEQKKSFKTINNCKITGFVDNVQDYLKAMDIFVMPSLTETTSLVTLEAMATGLPVITSKIGFIKTYINKGKNGLFFPKNSARILAAKIIKLLEDQEQQGRLGRNARKTVAYIFSWERSINRIKKLLLAGYYHHK
ncbi:MAG TPA: glycosyltransferase [Candidatus Nanoarchaeia archaeon]|nr:glycosyltransferase [Candidatus Nanoarchaeia archaeon]